MQFQKAERKKSKLRLMLTGPSGSGKTYGALLLASGLGKKIAVIDTEQGSASLYSHLVDFDSLELTPPYTPERYREALKLAVQSGYEIVIIDSVTHEWAGSGGCLELLESIAKTRFKNNSWAAWNEITPRHRAFIDDMLTSPVHIIVTARSKTETAQVEVNGRKQVQKLGMKTEQRDGIEYEFTTVLDLVHDGHFAMPSKDRTGIFSSADPIKLSPEVGENILRWLESGVEPKNKSDQSGKAPEETLQGFINAVNKAKSREDVEKYWKAISQRLAKYPQLLSQANDHYQARKGDFDLSEM